MKMTRDKKSVHRKWDLILLLLSNWKWSFTDDPITFIKIPQDSQYYCIVSEWLAELFNKHIKGVFPNSLKTTCITPVPVVRNP